MNIRDGLEVTLDQVLDQREYRVFLINDLMLKYPDASILSFKLNIPGPIKNNEMIQYIYQNAMNNLTNIDIIEQLDFLDNITGPESILAINKNSKDLKRETVRIEESHPLGRLFDFDVVNEKRSTLNLPRRRCLLCEKDAFECGRSRTHSVDELLDFIDALVKKVYNESSRG